MPLTPGCLPQCPPEPPPLCPPVDGPQPGIANINPVSTLSLTPSGMGTATGIDAVMNGTRVIVSDSSGTLYSFDTPTGLVEDLVLTNSINLDGLSPLVGFLTILSSRMSLDGERYYTVASSTLFSNVVIVQWNLGTPFDVGTIDIPSTSVFETTGLSGVQGFTLSQDESMFYLFSSAPNTIDQYNIIDPTDISTAVLTPNFFPTEDSSIRSMKLNLLGTKLIYMRRGSRNLYFYAQAVPPTGDLIGTSGRPLIIAGNIPGVVVNTAQLFTLSSPNQTYIHVIDTVDTIQQFDFNA